MRNSIKATGLCLSLLLLASPAFAQSSSLGYVQCLEEAKEAYLEAQQECNEAYAAAYWSKLPFGKAGSIAGLKAVFCTLRASQSYDAAVANCHSHVLGGGGGGGTEIPGGGTGGPQPPIIVSVQMQAGADVLQRFAPSLTSTELIDALDLYYFYFPGAPDPLPPAN